VSHAAQEAAAEQQAALERARADAEAQAQLLDARSAQLAAREAQARATAPSFCC
jgi:hypothetical protein